MPMSGVASCRIDRDKSGMHWRPARVLRELSSVLVCERPVGGIEMRGAHTSGLATLWQVWHMRLNATH